jgi:hypothetical protein
MHVSRVARPAGAETLRVMITRPKSQRAECDPSEELLRRLGRFLASAPPDWRSYHLKARRKRQGGWDASGEFSADPGPEADAPGDWVANSRQTEFGVRWLGTSKRFCVRKVRKLGWVLTESRRFLFIPLGTRTTKLGACSRIFTHWDSGTGKHVIELEAAGRSSVRLHETHSKAERDWLVDTLQELLCVPVEATKMLHLRG